MKIGKPFCFNRKKDFFLGGGGEKERKKIKKVGGGGQTDPTTPSAHKRLQNHVAEILQS